MEAQFRSNYKENDGAPMLLKHLTCSARCVIAGIGIAMTENPMREVPRIDKNAYAHGSNPHLQGTRREINAMDA